MYRYVSDPDATAGVTDSIRLLINTETAPPVAAPLLRTTEGRNWVTFGTGRLYSDPDIQNNTQNMMFSVFEPRGAYGEQAASGLVDVTGVQVSATDGTLTPPVEGATTFDELQDFILTEPNVTGWKLDLDAVNPADKITLSPQSSGQELLFVSFSPEPIVGNVTQCTATFGESFISAVNLTTGVPTFIDGFEGVLGTNTDGFLNSTEEFSDSFIASFSIISTLNEETGESEITAIGGGSAGDLPTVSLNLSPDANGRTSWTELEVE